MTPAALSNHERSDSFTLREQAPGLFLLEGELSFVSVPRALKESAGLFTGSPLRVTFDLAGVARADSAGLALLLEWRRRAGQAGMKLRFANIPGQLRAIAHVVGVDEMLAVH